jgi:LEA14-like dessication related protein
MNSIRPPTARQRASSLLAWLMLLAALLALSGCESLGLRDPLRVSVAGVEPLPGEGLELRFNVRLRVQNPNDGPVEYDGVALDLEVNGRPLASGVSDQKGTVPRYGEAVLSVPVTVSAFSAVRQALGLAQGAAPTELPYVVSGKLAGGVFGTVRFSHSGTLKLPQ